MDIISTTQRLAEESAAAGQSVAYQRLEALFDQSTFREIDTYAKGEQDPAEAVTGYGYIDGTPCYAFAQNREVCGGAMGRAQAAKIRKIYDLAEKTGLPVIGIYDSDGAHLAEGVDAMTAYGELIYQANRLSGVIPQISIVLGPCVGTAALMACGADIVIMAEDASLYLSAAAKVNGEKQGAGSAKAVFASGTVQLLAHDEADALEKAKIVLGMFPINNLSPVPAAQAIPAEGGCMIRSLVDGGSQLELSAAFGPELHTSFARIEGVVCGIVGMKSSHAEEIGQDACAKAARFVRMCDSFAIPIITFVDAAGFSAQPNEELSRSVRNAAMVANAYAEATTIKISVISGKAYGPIYTVFAGKGCNADWVIALPEAEISTLPPETAVTILYADRQENTEDLIREYISCEATPFVAASKGYIDDIIEQNALRSSLSAALEMLSGKRVSTLAKKHANMPL